ncbi:CubicO group peptidase (beta-lactamase class C family) [Rhizomicrobium palustre]|uniref:CubicO group peptidase (Beta-lactamase class C family) n=1 Tax=Rhizomicrobium palustre TaxID=189966 RepID=A0A846MV23_9PROT|nr:serine hydrolase domain-containing protein [Rhizomicrobium palustre]NIK87075.1 CubicO group peptidase (beta-lactamase class C family) [Rhizomicrobium palustre]
MLAAATPAVAASDRALDSVLAGFDKDEHPDLKGVVVLRDGKIVAERYFNGETPETLHDIRSAGKSITALLMGIAMDQRHIRSVGDPVARYWPEAQGSAIGDVPLRDVLTMRSGLAAFDEDPASPGNEDKMDEAADPLAFVLSLPRADPPGTRYRYNSVTAYVAGAVVAKATGQTLAAFAGANLFAPLGIKDWQWSADQAGYTKGQGNLSLTTRSLAKIGELVRKDGEYHGRRIVAATWLHEALAPKVMISASDPFADGYGYFWYSKLHEINGKPVQVSFASGNGGNKIYVVPSRHLVVAITSSAYGRGYGQRRSEAILKAILSASDK